MYYCAFAPDKDWWCTLPDETEGFCNTGMLTSNLETFHATWVPAEYFLAKKKLLFYFIITTTVTVSIFDDFHLRCETFDGVFRFGGCCEFAKKAFPSVDSLHWLLLQPAEVIEHRVSLLFSLPIAKIPKILKVRQLFSPSRIWQMTMSKQMLHKFLSDASQSTVSLRFCFHFWLPTLLCSVFQKKVAIYRKILLMFFVCQSSK